MNKITLHDKTFKPFISNAELEGAIDRVADRIRDYYEERDSVPIFLCVLNGAIMFTAALMKRLNFKAELVSVKMTSYCGTQTTGEVKVPMGLTASVEGRDVLVIEDIIDSGYTLQHLKTLLYEKGAADVKICSMLLKPDALKVPLKADFVGKEIPNDFIVGYGLDYDELGRNLDSIYVLDNMKYYILFGPPGAGKGTHAGAIAEKYNLKHISTGELLRAEIAAGSPLGMEAKSLIDKGCLVPDSVVEGMIGTAFDTIKGYDGFLLDGFPRTMGQAEDLDKMLADRGSKVNAVISLMIPDETIFERIRHRATVEGRADDASDEVIANRIKTYHTQTEPLIGYYKEQGKYYEISCTAKSIEENRERVLAMMDKIQ